ncbi:DBF4-type zinc finger-containing protein 2 [Osmerus eperlanus]|uniref:DBF4-type zinc finger-containing protein 2 n=1 Tax=Osmerus eperlanus TaxID=29151 RepID=UPI002E1069AF
MLERFLLDVIQHHPHRYGDPRPSHADLPSLGRAPSPRKQLDMCVSEEDGLSLSTRELLPSSDSSSCQLLHVQEMHTHSPRPCIPHSPPLHRKAHRKTNRRRERCSSSSSLAPRGLSLPHQRPGPGSPDPKPRKRDRKQDEAFSSDGSDGVGDVIEEVIQRLCYGRSPALHHQGDTDSFHLSLPASLCEGSGDSEDWDGPVQVALEQCGGDGRALTCLMGAQVSLEEQGYSSRLASALHPAGALREPNIEEILPAPPHIPPSFLGKTWTQVLLEDEMKVEAMVREFRQGHYFCYFDSESLARCGRRSGDRKGRSRDREGRGQSMGEAGILSLAEHDDDPECTRRRSGRSFRMASRCQVVKVSHGTQTTPLIIPRVRPAPACQTAIPLDSPAPCQDLSTDPETPPQARAGPLHLPPSYLRVMTPLQPSTALLYILSSPGNQDTTPRLKPVTRGRKRRRSSEGEGGDVGVKVKYKQVPLRYYDPATNRILKTPPRGLLPPLAPGAPRPPQPHVVRQLFRNLGPDINSERLGHEGKEVRGRQRGGGGRDGSRGSRERGRSAGSAASGSQLEPGVKGQGSSEAGSSVTSPFSRSSLSNSSRFLLATLTPDSTPLPEAPRPPRRAPRPDPPRPERRPALPYRLRRPGARRGRRREGKSVSRGSLRGRHPRIITPPAKGLSPPAQPRKGASRRAVENRQLTRPGSPTKASTPLKTSRVVGLRTSPRLTPTTLPNRSLRRRDRR